MIKLKKVLCEQGVLQALKSIVTPIGDAISQFDIPENEQDAERAADWEAIQTNIQKFFEQFPQFTPESEKELDAFEKWLKRNKRIMTPNNTLSMLSKAYMGKGTDANHANSIQKLLNKLVDAYKDDVFKDTRANEFETITKQALAYSKGELQKAKDYFLNFMLKNLNKISKYKLGVTFQGKEGVEDPVGYNSDLIGSALDLPTSYVETKLKAQLDKVEQAVKYGKEEQHGAAINDFINAVLAQYSKEAKVDPKDKQVIAKVKKECEKVIKLDYDLSFRNEFEEAKRVALDMLFGRKARRNEEGKPEDKSKVAEFGIDIEDPDYMDKLYDAINRKQKKIIKNMTKSFISEYPEFKTKIREVEDAVTLAAENEEINVNENETISSIYDSIMKAILNRMNKTPEKAVDKLSKMKAALEDVIKKNPPVGKLNKNQLSRLPEIISVALKNNNVTEEDELKDVFPKVYPFIVDELKKVADPTLQK